MLAAHLVLACFGVAAFCALLVSALVPLEALPRIAPAGVSTHHCPLCGLTTATYAMIRGDLSAAAAAHPLGPVVYGLLWLLAVGGTAAAVRWWRLARPYLARRSPDASL
ncbi:MAG TPA: DUF2752 domain-containing protein [bacterium]|nr:DUF2752 domain-containing protein [bacterium]